MATTTNTNTHSVGTDKNQALQKLQQEYADCSKCEELCANRTNVVFGVGNPTTCSLVIIGEAPGKNEDLKNEPFVGRSGQVLNSLLEEIGLSRDDVYITNTALCRPPENRNPTSQELANCRPRLDEQLKILKPKVVVTLGNFATQYMLQTTTGISQLRGKTYEKAALTIIPTFHPAVVLYSGNNPAKRQILLDDFLLAKKIIEKEKNK